MAEWRDEQGRRCVGLKVEPEPEPEKIPALVPAGEPPEKPRRGKRE